MSNFFGKHPASRLGTVQVLQDTGSQSAITTGAFGSATQQVRICSPKAGYYRVDASNAVIGDSFLPPNWPEYVTCNPGQTLSWISSSTSTGTITVTECW